MCPFACIVLFFFQIRGDHFYIVATFVRPRRTAYPVYAFSFTFKTHEVQKLFDSALMVFIGLMRLVSFQINFCCIMSPKSL